MSHMIPGYKAPLANASSPTKPPNDPALAILRKGPKALKTKKTKY